MTQAGKPFSAVYHRDDGDHNPIDNIRPDLVYLQSKNQYLVVWRSPLNENEWGTFGRVLNTRTRTTDCGFQISERSSLNYKGQRMIGFVSIAYNKLHDVALVVWSESTGPQPLTGDIYGRFVSSDGKIVGSQFRITGSSTSVCYESFVRVAWNAKSNRYLVLWEGPNQQGFKMPYSALVDGNGNVAASTLVGELYSPNMEEYRLYSVVSNPITGQWIAMYDKFVRIIGSDGQSASSPITLPSSISNILSIYDAFVTPSCYYLVGISPFQQQNKIQLWSATLTFDAKIFSTPNTIIITDTISHARLAFNPALKCFLAFYSIIYSKNVDEVFWCSKLDMNGVSVDNKPVEVLNSHVYQPTKGYASCAVNLSNTETLIVWSCPKERGPLHDGPYTYDWKWVEIEGRIVDIEEGLIVVKDEFNELCTEAEVWINGELAGLTDVSGWLKHPVKLGDKIIAKKLVCEHQSGKDGHVTPGYGNWDFHVWLTSAYITEDGLDIFHEVFFPPQPQELVIKKETTLIGFNLIASIEWTPNNQDEILKMQNFLINASNRMYNATDGQFFLEHIRIGSSKKDWGVADLLVYHGQGRCHNYDVDSMKTIFMYQLNENSLPVDESDYLHELLHYFCHLMDEYDENDSKNFAATCTRRYSQDTSGDYVYGGKKSSCPMCWMNSYKLCTNLPENPHNMQTYQSSESCWDVLYRIFMNTPSIVEVYGRWQLRHPKTRGNVMVGPDKIPVDAWCTLEQS